MQTIKFMYNTCLPVNIILKKGATDIFSVLSSFDMDIICKGWDIETKQFMDLSENLPDNKATWNKWNSRYYNPELWEVSRVLRQLERCFRITSYNVCYTKLLRYEDNDGIFQRKIYRPNRDAKDGKWYSNVDTTTVQGWDLFPKTGEIGFIQSSFKDLGPTWRIFKEPVGLAPNTEGSFLPLNVWHKIKNRRKKWFLFYLWLFLFVLFC